MYTGEVDIRELKAGFEGEQGQPVKSAMTIESPEWALVVDPPRRSRSIAAGVKVVVR